MARRWNRTLIAVLVAVASGAGTAEAATVSENPAQTVLTIDTTDRAPTFVEITISGADLLVTGGDGSFDPYFLTPLTAGNGCLGETAIRVRCLGYASYDTVLIRTGGGNDTVWMFSDVAAEIDADLGAGRDHLIAASSQRVVARGGPGPDGLFGGGASDRLEGGPGSDSLGSGNTGAPGTPGGSDELIGGDGFDGVSYGDRSTGVQLSLDGVANDGDPAAGERDNLIDVEDLSGGTGDDVIVGDAEANNLSGFLGRDRLEGGAGFDSYDGGLHDDTILARDGLSERVVCDEGDDSAETDDIDRPLDCERRSSSPDLQPDRDGDGVDRPLDCDDLDPVVRPGAFDAPGDGRDQDCDGADAVDGDRDRDGFSPPRDCDDGNVAIHPGADDVAGNAVDEDCDGVPEPYPRASALVMLAWRVGAVTELVSLAVGDLDGGERVTVRCRGKGCRFARRRHRVKADAEVLRLAGDVRGMKLRPGATLSVAVRRADGVTKTISFRMRKGKAPRRTQRCAAPGPGKVAGC